MTEHIKPLTSMRGIAALLVVLHHFFYYLLGDIGKEIGLYTKFFFNGYLWVDFFFILSGFIMAHVYLKDFSSAINRRNYRIYLFSRFARIYPLHILIIFLFIGLELTKGYSAFTGSQNLTALFSNIFLLQAFDFNNPPWFGGATYWNQPSWSISAEWIAYLFLPLLLFLLSKIRKVTAVVVYLSALFCLFFLVKLTYGHLNFIGVHSIIRCILESTLGIITYQVYNSKINRRHLKRDWIFILSLIGVFMVMHYNWNDVLIIPIFCLLILSASINNRVVAKI
ncbi:MAG: acyltransferase, partial [Microcoleaceae cyanobacterium]